MSRPPLDHTPVFGPKGQPLDATQSAARAGVSKPQWWKEVRRGNYPAPFYPSPRNPRWWGPEIDAANESRRMLPRHAKELRRRARLGHNGGPPLDPPPPTADEDQRETIRAQRSNHVTE